ncbi:hypothetical protein SLS54_010121 [Diplodia seriata]
MTTARAIVSRAPLNDGGWKIEDVKVRDVGDDELLVRIVASGICHTDILFAGLKEGPGVIYPSVKGHEDLQGSFFGQSSFASRTVVKSTSVVNVRGLVKDDEELKLFAPLGCGIQTGSGTIVNVAQAGPQDTVAVLGLGGVGLSAIMAAKLRGCRTIIGVDKMSDREAIARELGATHFIDTSKLADPTDIVAAVQDVTDGYGTSVTVDTTGFLPLIERAMDFTRLKGKLVQVGSAPFDAKLDVHIFPFMVAGKQYIGAVEGDVQPAKFVPQMIEWYRAGKFPVDRLVKYYKADEWRKAVDEMHSGHAVKAVITW